MLGYFLLLVSVALANAQLWEPSDQCTPGIHHLLPHEYDCTKFYYCEYGMKYIEPTDCPAGTEFSDAEQVCIHPSLANCTLPGYSTAAPSSTAAPTEVPSSEAPTTTSTSAPSTTTTLSPTTTTTEAPTTAPSTEAPTEAPSSVAPTTNATSSPSTTTAAPSSTESPEILPNGCPADWSISQLLPHETQCNLFYYCNEGELVVTECPAGTAFNPQIQVCDWPENVGCELNGNNTTTEPTTQGPAVNVTTTEAPTEAPSSEAPTTNSTSATSTTTTSSPSINITTTEAPTVAPSTTAPATNATSTPSTTTQSPNESTTTAAPSSTESPEILPNGCPADWSISQLLPHETQCNLFYYCNEGELVVTECPAGTAFNPQIQACDWPENVGCELNGNNTTTDPTTQGPAVNVTTTETPTEAPSSEAPTTNSTSATSTTTTSSPSINITITEAPTVAPSTTAPATNATSAPSTTTQSPNESTTTAAPSSTESPEILPNGCPADWSISQLLPHETQCNLFYYCNFGELVLFECPGGTYFNPKIQVCDWPANVECDSNSNNTTAEPTTQGPAVNITTTEAPATNATSAPSTTTQSPNTNEPSTSAPNVSTTTSAPSSTESPEILPNGCPADWSIHQLLPHESQCDLFYYCNFGELVLRQCPAGTHFNPTIQVCDWPANARCQLNGNNTTTEPTTQGPAVNATTTEAPTVAPTTNSTSAPTTTSTSSPSINITTTEAPTVAPSSETPATDATSAPSTTTTSSPINATTTEAPTVPPSSEAPTTNSSTAPSTTTESTNTTEPSTSAPNASTTEAPSSTQSPEILPNGCPADWSISQLLPHETQCNLFYYCNFGELVLTQCPQGTAFNPEIQACDFPDNVQCPGSKKCAEECNIAPWADSSSCDRYWQCEGSQASLIICSEGLLFNEETKTCDLASNVNCSIA